MPLKKLSVKELAALRGCVYRTALTEHQKIREKLGKEFVTYKDFAEYEGITVAELDAILGKKK